MTYDTNDKRTRSLISSEGNDRSGATGRTSKSIVLMSSSASVVPSSDIRLVSARIRRIVIGDGFRIRSAIMQWIEQV